MSHRPQLCHRPLPKLGNLKPARGTELRPSPPANRIAGEPVRP